MDKLENEVADKGGRRSGIDRRQVDIEEAAERRQADIEEAVAEERRSGKERRSGNDRRDGFDYRNDDSERRESFQIK